MNRFVVACLIVSSWAFIVSRATAADDSKDDAIRKDRQQIAGTWRIVQLVINGNPAREEDAKKLSVVNGTDGTWSLHVEGKEISRGTSTFDPTAKPKAIDFTPTVGEGKGMEYHGIYELGEKRRRMCFAPAGKDRPSDFSAPTGSDHIAVTFEREESPP